ncbi:DUF2218 domain-containing protein [Sphingorhabdus sp.]|uniref:DUF2218 domain-containing protein n=1 Tax=Sphingorhabdus sp. TaxID=1902408 RepID=UPI00391BCEC4
MSFIASARVPTDSASKYLQQVCKHWEHNLPVCFDASHGEIIFAKDARGANWPADATVSLDAEADALICTIQASSEGQRDGLKGALERHIDRFAFREGPLVYNWIDR